MDAFLGIPTSFLVLAMAFGCLMAVQNIVRDIERRWKKTEQYALLRFLLSTLFNLVWWVLMFSLWQWYFTLPHPAILSW